VFFVFVLFVFVLCLVCPMLPVFLDCPFLIACSVFSDVYETFNQWWITIPTISTKRTITSHLNSLNRKNTTSYDIGNPGPGLGQAQICGVVKPR
jgi:hypothetical protein